MFHSTRDLCRLLIINIELYAMEKYFSDCGIYLFGGSLLLGVGLHGAQEFLDSDYIKFPQNKEVWSSTAGYTSSEWVWFVISVYFIPTAVMCFLVTILQTFKGNYDIYLKLGVFYALLAVAVWLCVEGAGLAHETLNCGIFCF